MRIVDGLLLCLSLSLGLSQAQEASLRLFSDRLLAGTVAAWKTQLTPRIVPTTTNTLTAIQALLHDQADAIAIVRPLLPEEVQQYQSIHGHPPISVPVGLDALGIFARRDSQLRTLTLSQIPSLFANSDSCGSSFRHRPTPQVAALYGLTSANGGHHLFSRLALCGATLNPKVTLLAEDIDVIEAVARQPGTIGYASTSLSPKSGSRLLAIQVRPAGRPLLPTAANLIHGRYPLTHYLHLYFHRDTQGMMDFVRSVLSANGQSLLGQQGFVPLGSVMVERILKDLQRETD